MHGSAISNSDLVFLCIYLFLCDENMYELELCETPVIIKFSGDNI